jgi:hypothetical protein
MAESMVERVARAMCEAEWGKGSWLLVSDHSRNKAMRHASAAIEAMREPTDAIGTSIADASPSYTMPETRRRIWQAGIDAALNEQVAG